MTHSYPLEVYDNEFSALIEYFEDVLGEQRIHAILSQGRTSLTPHFWYRYIKQYKRWQEDGSKTPDVTANANLIRFGVLVRQIQLFERDWCDGSAKTGFLNRLKSSSEVEGLLFELRTGVHFLRRGLDIHWVKTAGGDKSPDLEIACSDGTTVIVECTCRKKSFGRTICSETMAEDLLNAAARKRQSGYNWSSPRLVAVSVPEEIDWGDQLLKNMLDNRIRSWIANGKMGHVNVLFLLGSDSIVPRFDSVGKLVSYLPDQPVFVFGNPTAQPPLPRYMAAKLTA